MIVITSVIWKGRHCPALGVSAEVTVGRVAYLVAIACRRCPAACCDCDGRGAPWWRRWRSRWRRVGACSSPPWSVTTWRARLEPRYCATGTRSGPRGFSASRHDTGLQPYFPAPASRTFCQRAGMSSALQLLGCFCFSCRFRKNSESS
jgi:hypothetical protein